MSLADIRRARLRALIAEMGSQKALADLCGFQSDNYLSQLLSPSKSFGERTARNIERRSGKPEKWLDSFDESAAPQQVVWPFQVVDRALWERLHPLKKRELENTFQQLIIGASVQEAAAPPRKRKA